MTNQSKWLISAYAVFLRGGVLVPLDYKLTAAEHCSCWRIPKRSSWSSSTTCGAPSCRRRSFTTSRLKIVLVTEAPLGAELGGAYPLGGFPPQGRARFRHAPARRCACIVYSSGTGGRPKGCVLTHENYLEQCRALTAWYPFWPGVRYLSILPTNHAIDFMVGFIGPFVCGACVVHLRTLRPEFVRDAFVRYRITYVSLVPMVAEESGAGAASEVR